MSDIKRLSSKAYIFACMTPTDESYEVEVQVMGAEGSTGLAGEGIGVLLGAILGETAARMNKAAALKLLSIIMEEASALVLEEDVGEVWN